MNKSTDGPIMTRNRITTISLLLALCLASVTTLWTQTATTPDAQRIMESVKILASDSCGGRAPGSTGIEKAADYIRTTFKALGLQPGGFHGDFDAPFSMTSGATMGTKNSMMFLVKRARPGVPIDKVPAVRVGWKLGVDYQPFAFSSSGTVSGPVVFAGYGLSSKGYDDYRGVDVKGAIVIVIRGLPKWAEKNADYKQAADVRIKATIARDKGAAAICFVNEAGDKSDVLSRFSLDRLGKDAGILAMQVRRTPAASIFPKEVKTLFVAENEINSSRKPVSYALTNTTAEVSVEITYNESKTSNIVGMVHGSDASLADQYIVVGAHYDHLGMGNENSLYQGKDPAIHHGADDNASGTAGVLELARRFAANPAKRTVVLMAFSGEESGLVGSKHWVDNATLPFDNLMAMINMDMIGRLNNNKLSVMGVGTSVSWPAIIDSANAATQFTISTTADGFGPSDHSSFTAKGVPTLFFFTGLHSDYHRPSDTWDKLNYDGEAKILDMVERTVRIIADNPTALGFKEGADKPTAKTTSTGFKVVFGVIPDYSDNPQGLRISGVRPDTPAARAGLQADDIITKFGSTTVKNIYDLTAAMTSANPGDVVEIGFIRDDKPVTVKATLVGH